MQLRTVTLFGEPIKWVHTTLCVTLDKRLTWSTRMEQVSRRTAHRMGLLVSLLNRSELSVRNGVLLFKQLIQLLDGLRVPHLEIRSLHTYLEVTGVTIHVSSPGYGHPFVPQ
jgi:hypothetical protein